ncbi:LysR family transcriptional regulator [Pelosinus sp. sgz500959]|uniref:LysR family transcriptional regulator n=1 Tax=Pelosinus sp. sgz500959 TaxID=3242472 RepID=UPI00366EC3DD
MDIRELEYFVTVSELENFTAAAKRLHISQPAISKSVHKLEEELGFHLLDRTQKRVSLTEEGKVFLTLAQDILSRILDAQNTMAEYKTLTRGTFRIAVPPLLGAYVFPDLFAAFKDKYPSLEMLVIEDGSSAAIDLVQEENVHVGLIILPPDSTDFHSHLITSQQIVVCLPTDHPLSKEPFLTFDQLKDEPMILYNEGFLLRQIILDEYAKIGATPKVALSTNQIQTIKAFVAKGVGISFLPVNSIKEARHMTKIPLSPRLFLDMGLIWKPDKVLPLACKAFIDFVNNYSYND